jgi:hypothetical protein
MIHWNGQEQEATLKGIPSAESSYTLWGMGKGISRQLSLAFSYARRLIRKEATL